MHVVGRSNLVYTTFSLSPGLQPPQKPAIDQTRQPSPQQNGGYLDEVAELVSLKLIKELFLSNQRFPYG